MKKAWERVQDTLGKFSAQLILVALIIFFGIRCGSIFFPSTI